MDNTIKLDQELEENIKKSIILTNRVIHKWINLKGIKTIFKSEIDAIFLGNFKKYVLSDNIDFKRFRKCIIIFTTNNYITNINYHSEENYHFRNNSYIKNIFKIINSIEEQDKCFIEHLDDKYTREYLSNSIDYDNLINFKQIKKIIF